MPKDEVAVHVGHQIFVGHHRCCDGMTHQCERTLHIWRSDHPNSSCEVSKGKAQPRPGDLVVEYKDGKRFALSETHKIEEVEAFFRVTGPVLVHCAVGQTRSPTLALIGKVMRGCNVYQAYADILRALHEQRGIAWNICLDPTKELLGRYGTGTKELH